MIRYEHSFQRVTRQPARLPPPGSVDATFERVQRMHRTLEIAHGVIVQPTAYGTDHTLLLACLAENPAYRGTAIVEDGVSDDELLRLHAAGVRGARFNFKRAMGPIPTDDVFVRSVRRIAQLGWHAKVRSTGEELLAYEPLLRTLDITIVIDHMGHLDGSGGPEQPACKLIVDLLEHHGWWIMLSNADKHLDPPWDAAVEVAQAFVAAAPDRTLWATDWPHLGFRDRPVQNDADLLELFYRYAPDENAVRRILVDNPTRLYGFTGAR